MNASVSGHQTLLRRGNFCLIRKNGRRRAMVTDVEQPADRPEAADHGNFADRDLHALMFREGAEHDAPDWRRTEKEHRVQAHHPAA